ncbi:MAG TPA: cupin domain-containing protein [Steroidobacteraceae bacterium]|nr:cupin domain-containing protein [Steroidobacteraceae bacterium]
MTEAKSRIVEWNPDGVEAEVSKPGADRLLAGDPEQQVRNIYADAEGRFFAGVWSSTVGRWRVAYSEHEFCRLTAGVVRIEAEDGEVRTFRAGDSFIVPAGFRGIWEVLEPAEKQYVIFEPGPG